jgi:hypothetical protein
MFIIYKILPEPELQPGISFGDQIIIYHGLMLGPGTD